MHHEMMLCVLHIISIGDYGIYYIDTNVLLENS